MSDRIHELLTRNIEEVFGEGDAARRRAAIGEFYTDDCVVYGPPVFSSGMTHWTSSQEACVRLTPTLYIRRTASHRRSITPADWRGGPARVARSPIIPVWT
jgi:hypothetical protein